MTMKTLTLLSLGLVLAGSLTACGRNANTLPPVNYYPNQLLAAQQQNNLGAPSGNNLGNDSLPSDITQGQVGSVVGRIVTRSGRPLHNALVSLESDPSIQALSVQGDFSLLNVPAGAQTLVIRFGDFETSISVNVIANTASSPQPNPIVLEDEAGSGMLAFSQPNRQQAAFKVDQDLLNQWQPKGIVASGGILYVSAVDVRNVFKKGTVIKLSTESGKDWKNMGSMWLGLRHPISSNARGITLNGSNALLVVDEKGGIYSVDASTNKVTRTEAEGALDIAAGGGKVFIYSQRGLEQADDSGQGATLVSNVNATGGIDVDGEGNAYVPVQNTVVKVSADGQVTTLINQYLSTPADVAIDRRTGDIYVLDAGEIKRFTANGTFVVDFGSGALSPVAITCDENGALYVADFGRDHKTAQVIQYEPASPATFPSPSDTSAADVEESEDAEEEYTEE
jgi:hypothetical protein